MVRSPALRLACSVLALVLGLACRRSASVTDSGPRSGGATLDAGGPARRIVSLVPNTTELLFALGAGDRVVGVSRFDDHPPEVSRLPRVGGMIDPSFEAIAALRPEVIVGIQGPANRAVLDRFTDLGVRQVFPRVESIEEVHRCIDVMAALTDRREAARALHLRLRARVASVERAVRGRPRPRVLAVFGQRPLVVASTGSWYAEMITLAGGQNALEGSTPWPMISLEQVLTARPDVVLDLAWYEGHGAVEAAWAGQTAIPAVRNRRVVRLQDTSLLHPGPRLGEALVVIARAIHPGLQME